MGLTGGTFITLMCVLAVVVVAAAVKLLGRYPGRTPRDIGVRAGLVASTQVAVLFAILLLVNSWGEFYASWGDLLGSDHTKAQISQQHRRTPPNVQALQEGGHLTAAGGGRIDQVTVNGPRSGLSGVAYVVQPAQYAAQKTRTFPAILVLSADPRRLATEINPTNYPAVYVVVAAAQGCVDAPGGVQAETFLTQDVPEEVSYVPAAAGQPASGYRVSQQWGVIGDEQDGYCTAKVVLRRSDRFVAGASMGGSYTTPTGNLYGGSPAMQRENTLLWRLQNRQPQPPASLLLAPNNQAKQLAGAAQDPLHIELAQGSTALPAALPELQRWLAARLNAVLGPNAAGGAVRPGALPTQGGHGFKGHRGQP